MEWWILPPFLPSSLPPLLHKSYGAQKLSSAHTVSSVQIASRFRGNHEVETGEASRRTEKENRRPQSLRPVDFASHWRRPQTKYRKVDFKRRKRGVAAEGIGIEYEPKRSSRIALIKYAE